MPSASQDGQAPPPKQDTARTTMYHLPGDVIIEILSHTLTPKDLISVGQTSSALRAYSKAKAVWRCAWSRDPSLPQIPSNLVLPESMKGPKDNWNDRFFNTSPPKVGRIEFLERSESTSVATHSSLADSYHDFEHRARYLQIMEMRWRMRQFPVVCEPVIVPEFLPKMSRRHFMNMAVSQNGDIVVLWQLESLHILDLRRGGMKYEIPFRSNVRVWDENPIAAEIFELEGQEGVIVAASFREPQRVNILFFPLSQSSSTLLHLAEVQAPNNSKIADILLADSHLIIVIGTARGAAYYIRIVDLTQGVIYSIYVKSHVRRVQIFQSKYLLIAISPGTVLGAHLRQFQSDAEFITFPLEDRRYSWIVTVIAEDQCNSSIFLPRFATHDPSIRIESGGTSQHGVEICPIWYHSRDSEGWYPKSTSLVKGSMPPPWVDCTSINDSARTSLPISISGNYPVDSWAHLSSRFNHTHLPYRSWERIIPSFQSRSKIEVFSYNWRAGDSQLLGIVASRKPCLEGLVLSSLRVSPTQSAIVHKPLFIREQNREGIVPLRYGDDSASGRLKFRWSESGGVVVVLTEDRSSREGTIHIYQL
ncbi:hypothetical protein DL93DRAFT_2230276 [Clavulina sp. PMI_390]|nr:hypothetical protein DL93DRAFT_2230276 [Clavulina sp. PMI_390]